jgi:hypothetical protein
MSNEKQVMVSLPIALRSLIQKNNELLRRYQASLVEEIQEANIQMMQILNLDPNDGWRLDMDNMVYVRPEAQEQPVEEKKTTK